MALQPSSRLPLRLVGRLATLVVLALTLSSSVALANERIDKLALQLRSAEDFRVRTQAALALGASQSKLAVDPLCGGLGDANATVRTAAAAALGKLALGGSECLEQRLEVEAAAPVKSALKKALAAVLKAREPAFTADTKYYVAIGKSTDKTGRTNGSVDALVRRGIASAVEQEPAVLLAPRQETETEGKARLAKRKGVKGFFLTVKIDPPKYANGSLTVRLEVLIFTYPGKALKATLPMKLTQTDTAPGSEAAEDELIQDAASRAMAKFIAKADKID